MSEPLTPERVTEIRERADRRMEKCRRRGQASLVDVECTKNEVHDLAAELDRLRAELGSKAPAEASGGRTGWVRDTLIAAGFSPEDVARVMAEVRAEQAAEIERLRAELAKRTQVDGFPIDCPNCGTTQSHCNSCGSDMYTPTGGA